MNRIALILVFVTACSAGMAKNVDLVTLPGRDTVQLTIYNSEDLTLVKETRQVMLKKGANQLQFSWANTLIDPTSVMFRVLEHADQIELLDTLFPGQKPQHLIWNIESKFEGQVKVEVSYFTSGLTWSMDYVGISDADETKMHFRGYVRVFNNSGEEYDNAEVRLIVGTINLVEKIADLARRRGLEGATLDDAAKGKFRGEVLRQAAAKAEQMAQDAPATEAPAQAKKIVKEGLSEYFLFSVAGTETIPNGWSKRMQAVEAVDVPFDIVYRMRTYQYGPRPVRFLIWRNDDEHKLGESPLPDGQVNLYRQLAPPARDGGRPVDGLAFVARQQIRYVPIKAEIEINTGPDDLVVYETRQMRMERLNFAFDQWNNVTGWDEKALWNDTIRNYRTKAITFELRRQWGGDADYHSEVKSTLFDYRTVETIFTIPARSKTDYPATVTTHMGSNKRQERVSLQSPPEERKP